MGYGEPQHGSEPARMRSSIASSRADMSKEGAAKANLSLIEAIAEDPFYIAATALASRPRRILKHGDSFLVLDSYGDIGATAGGADGLFHADTRFLSNLELRLQGVAPLLLGSSIRDDNSAFSVDLTNPDVYENDRIVLAKDTLHIVRTTFLWQASAYQRIAIQNHADRPITIHLAVGFGNDFADLFEVRGQRRPRRGKSRAGVVDAEAVLLQYQGLDNVVRSTRVLFEPAPTRLSDRDASYRLTLGPREYLAIFLTVECNPADLGRSPRFFPAMLASHRALKAATRNSATIRTSNDVFNEVLCRAMADLYMLVTDTPQGPYPYAGIPWYSTTFGRDGLITALAMLWIDPAIARGVLRRLAAYQARRDDPENDAQPGKILHEMRGGEMAALREVPFGLYYGSVDSTPLFVLLAGLYTERTGDVGTLRELWPAIEAGLAWIDGPGDLDRDGFVEYYRATEQGLANQGWKDSYDAVFHADGRLAEGPIALAEVQGYVYAAKSLAATSARRLGYLERAAALEREAAGLQQRFEAAFWRPDLESYALALDGAKRPCEVRTSNAGQLLFTGIAAPERALKVAEGLLRPQFFSGWGIRTVSSRERRYNPMSYHNGSIWPHDNALIALGFGRYELKDFIAQVFTATFQAAAYMDLRRLPELFCGFQRRRGRGPTLYPVACSPQAWASGAPFLMLQVSLGLEFDVARNEIRLRNPCLPSFLQEVAISNLTLGGSSVDLGVHREPDGKVSLQFHRRSGTVQIGLV
jgi:glycogen debranching enzyme